MMPPMKTLNTPHTQRSTPGWATALTNKGLPEKVDEVQNEPK